MCDNRIDATAKIGVGVTLGSNICIGKNTEIKNGCIIEDNVTLGDDSYVDYNVIIRENVKIGNNSFIGANSILGEYTADFFLRYQNMTGQLQIGNHALIRSGSIVYGGAAIGDHFQTGHRVTIREKSQIGNYVSVGTLSDIQGECVIGDYVRMHSNVHIGQKSHIEDYVWIFPYVVLTNDPTPPSERLLGVEIKAFAVIATGSIILPGVKVESDSLVAAGAIVTKDVEKYQVVGGNPAKVISDIRNIKNRFTGEKVYPWRETFKRGMPWEDSDYQTWSIEGDSLI